MALQGTAALAMWWDMAAEQREEFEHWHSHEHFPERLGVPGFLRASRWLAADGGERVFVVYELQDHAVLASPAYLARLNAPTPWSTRLMPHHRNMHRAQCRVLVSAGGLVAARVLSLRFRLGAAEDAALLAAWSELAREAAGSPGLAGLHLLRHDAPPVPQTTEQRIRGGDEAPDAVAVISAYDPAALERWAARLQDAALVARLGLPAGTAPESYRLSYSATAADVAAVTPR
jgi:hypothetical protein